MWGRQGPRLLFSLNRTIRLNSRFQSFINTKFLIFGTVQRTHRSDTRANKNDKARIHAREGFPFENGICCEEYRRVSFRLSYHLQVLTVSKESFLNCKQSNARKRSHMWSHSFLKNQHFYLYSHIDDFARKIFLCGKVSSLTSLFLESFAR